MTERIDWLPGLVLFDGDWGTYVEQLYDLYRKHYLESKPSFRGQQIGLKRHPVIDGKDATFWHLISEGAREHDRLPDFRRCERICWPRAIIDHAEENCIKAWENKRGSETRICLWLECENYLVVLAKRKTYCLLWTAYPTTQEHRKRKLRKEYENYLKS